MAAKVPFELIKENVTQGFKAQTAMGEHIAAFITCCMTGNWDQIEVHRVGALGSLDQWLDNLAAAHRMAAEEEERD